MKKYAVIVAGGFGTRMGSVVPKQFLTLAGKPLLWHTVNTFLRSYEDLQAVVVLPKEHMQYAKDLLTVDDFARVVFVQGGETRFHSVLNGLQQVQGDSVVFVHDGVRCLVSGDLIKRCYEAAVTKGNAVPAVKSVDSLRIKTAEGNKAIDRDQVWAVQTPQTFRSDILLDAFRQEYDKSFTDEASVVERLGVTINLVEGESQNIKITRPVDMLVAENYLNNLSGQGNLL